MSAAPASVDAANQASLVENQGSGSGGPASPSGSGTVTPSGTRGEALRRDPRVIEAKRLIREALGEHAGELNDVCPAQTRQATTQTDLIDRFTAVRGGPPLWPYFAAGIGNGPFVELADGSVKLDFIGGIGVHGGGHSHPDLVEAAIDGALEDTVMQGNLQQHPLSVEFMELLVDMACRGGANLRRILPSTSGAMANENALKIALHHRSPADRIIAFDNAFAGRSLALAALTDRAKYRAGLPLTLDVDYLPFRDPDHPGRSTRWAVDELRRLLDRHPGRYAAFWAEPIAGEGGYYAGSHDFFAALAEPLREHRVPIIYDEVQSFGRTAHPFAFQHYRLDEFADIVTVGKITQVCATLWRPELQPTGPILSQTFTGGSSAMSAGLAMLRCMDRSAFGEGGANRRLGTYFRDRLGELASRHPSRIRGPFGEEMMIAFTPDDGSFDAAKSMMDRLYEVGLLAFVCGDAPTRLRFLPPPLATTEAHIDRAVEILEGVLVSER